MLLRTTRILSNSRRTIASKQRSDGTPSLSVMSAKKRKNHNAYPLRENE
jgi:hypothetical protein